VWQAQKVAGGRDVIVMGGADTIRQALRAGLVDEIRLQIVPVLLGSGQPLFGGTDTIELERVSVEPSPAVTHLVYRPLR
jgi:dihydrofolate reductase